MRASSSDRTSSSMIEWDDRSFNSSEDSYETLLYSMCMIITILRASKRMRVSVSGSPTHLTVNPSGSDFPEEQGRDWDAESFECWNAGEGKAGSKNSGHLQMPVHWERPPSRRLPAGWTPRLKTCTYARTMLAILISYSTVCVYHSPKHLTMFQTVLFNWQGLQCLHSIGLKSRMLWAGS